MNEQLKKRLTGAVVLVALAVIFIPMLLDGGDDNAMPAFGSNVPAKPDYEFETIEIPLQLPAEPPRVDARVVETPQQAAAYEKIEPAPESIARLATAPPVRESATAPKPPPPAEQTATGPQGWVIQLGSFGKAANAMALRDKARAKGFTAFVEQVNVEGTLAYRVRVGPELQRERADALKTQIAKALGVEAMVMTHP